MNINHSLLQRFTNETQTARELWHETMQQQYSYFILVRCTIVKKPCPPLSLFDIKSTRKCQNETLYSNPAFRSTLNYQRIVFRQLKNRGKSTSFEKRQEFARIAIAMWEYFLPLIATVNFPWKDVWLKVVWFVFKRILKVGAVTEYSAFCFYKEQWFMFVIPSPHIVLLPTYLRVSNRSPYL